MSDSPTALDRLVSPAGLPVLGLELPLDNDWGSTRLCALHADPSGDGRPFGVADLTRHTELARLADPLGFAGSSSAAAATARRAGRRDRRRTLRRALSTWPSISSASC
ncbi:hypothetical protein AB0L35_10525 [Streptomyces sp. NPDC052309]|uniref:hypothetical protein n=1 Tax=Streptomyces sp. NPDC052309 TaxID=3155421 RepID=UPI0034417BCD